MCNGSKSGFATLLVPTQFCTKRSLAARREILFGSTLVMAVNEMYGPPVLAKVWTTILAVKKNMWYSIMKGLNCKVSSTWSNDDRSKGAACAHRKHGDGGKEKVSQLDFIIGPKERHDDCYICNEGKLWDSFDHYPMYARIQEGRDAEQFSGKRKKLVCEWTPKTVEHKIDFLENVMENDGHGVDEHFDYKTKKTIEFAAGATSTRRPTLRRRRKLRLLCRSENWMAVLQRATAKPAGSVFINFAVANLTMANELELMVFHIT